jgi:hypothetical protein
MNDTASPRLSGGEHQKSPEDIKLDALIKAEPDVFRLVDLVQLVDGKFLYQIETPFAGFPKYVIGSTDAENKAPHILLKCGTEWAADEAWRGFRQNPVMQTSTRIPL